MKVLLAYLVICVFGNDFCLLFVWVINAIQEMVNNYDVAETVSDSFSS